MNKIKGNSQLMSRPNPEKHTKYHVIDNTGSHLVKIEKKPLYEYYICDYCKKEIKIEKEWVKSTGGTVIFSKSITRTEPLKLALCNKCLAPARKEFEDE